MAASLPPLPVVVGSASEAVTPAIGAEGIGVVVGMSARAVGAPALACSDAFTSPDVLLMSDCFEMGRVHAVANTAEVVEFEPFGDITIHEPVRDPMCEIQAAELEASVSMLVGMSSPKQTITIRDHLSPEPFFERHEQLGSEIDGGIAVPPKPGVVLGAHIETNSLFVAPINLTVCSHAQNHSRA